jgi:adenylate cyclase
MIVRYVLLTLFLFASEAPLLLIAQPPGTSPLSTSNAPPPIRVRRQGTSAIDSLKNLLVSTEGDARIRVLRSLGWEYRKFDLLPSFDYALQSVELARSSSSAELAASLNVLGITYRNISNYPKSLECFVEALRIALKARNWREEGYAYNNMGDVYHLQGNDEWAANNVEKALHIFEKNTYLEGQGYCFARLGEIAESRKQFNEALGYNTRAYDIRRALGDTTQMYIALAKIGTVHQAERRFTQALDCYARALDFMRISHATSDVAAMLGRIAIAQLDMGNIRTAIQTAQEGFAFAQKSRTKIDIQELSMVLWRSYAALGEYKQAFEYQSLYLATRDSITSEQSIKQTAAIQIKYEIQRKQDEIEALENSHQVIRWALVVGLSMAIILIVILVNRSRLKQRTTTEILRQQGILTEQSKEIELANTEIQEKNLIIEEERQLSQRLLLNVLPAGIAARLMAGEKLIADRFQYVTVLFADIAGFTALSKRTAPEELVALLDTIFSEFDSIAEEFQLEKIKTIGDCYMLVGGLPEPMPEHCERVANAALAMRESVQVLNDALGLNVAMRMGMHTGEVVAGVIGKKKFSYDLWGDTVNTASRMESHGEAGRIHVSEEVFTALQGKFAFEKRGEIEVKGKGVMRTYFLTGSSA